MCSVHLIRNCLCFNGLILGLEDGLGNGLDGLRHGLGLELKDSGLDLVVSGLATSLGVSLVIVLAVVVVVKCRR